MELAHVPEQGKRQKPFRLLLLVVGLCFGYFMLRRGGEINGGLLRAVHSDGIARDELLRRAMKLQQWWVLAGMPFAL